MTTTSGDAATRGLGARGWAALGAGGAAAAIATALISEQFGWLPCELCLWQRWPYWIGLAVAVAAAALWRGSRAVWALAAAALVFAAGAGLGVFHSGVEFGWWAGLASCSAPEIAPGLSGGDLLAALEAADTAPRCGDREPFLFGLSMANWNVLASSAIAGCFALAARARASV